MVDRKASEVGSGLLVPDEKWPPVTVIVRGLLTVATGLAIAWWLWPEPTDGSAKVILVGAGLALAFGGFVMTVYGVVRAVEAGRR